MQLAHVAVTFFTIDQMRFRVVRCERYFTASLSESEIYHSVVPSLANMTRRGQVDLTPKTQSGFSSKEHVTAGQSPSAAIATSGSKMSSRSPFDLSEDVRS